MTAPARLDSPEAAVLSSMAAYPALERHGLDLLRDTSLASGVLYPALVRLRRDGLVESRWQDDGRRGYLLTADGVTALRVAPPATATGVIGTSAPGATTRSRSRTIARWLPATLIAAAESWSALSRPAGLRLSDLGVYVGAVGGRRHGSGLYDFMSAGHAPFTYPPFAGLLFWPLTFVATLPLQVAWLLATVATVMGLSVLLARQAGRPWHGLAPAIAAALVLSAPVSSDLKYGQVSVGLAALVTLDILVLRHSRAHGVLIGLTAAIKLTPLIFIPMLWFAGRRRAAIVATATFAACGAFAGDALPADSWHFWSTDIWRVDRLGYITSVGNQSLNGALMRADVVGSTRSWLVLIVAGGVAMAALWRASTLGRRGDWLSAAIVVGAASVVLSPVSWTHHQAWLVMAALLPAAGPAWARRAWIGVVLLVMILPVTALGPPVWSNARLLLAVAVAALVPLDRPVGG